jgi:hypothetical protein
MILTSIYKKNPDTNATGFNFVLIISNTYFLRILIIPEQNPLNSSESQSKSSDFIV